MRRRKTRGSECGVRETETGADKNRIRREEKSGVILNHVGPTSATSALFCWISPSLGVYVGKFTVGVFLKTNYEKMSVFKLFTRGYVSSWMSEELTT